MGGSRVASQCLMRRVMRRFSVIGLLVGVSACSPATSLEPAEPPPAPTSAATEERPTTEAPAEPLTAASGGEGYDRLLTGYDYPFEVKRFALTAGGRELSMAYMDESPAEIRGSAVVLLHGKNFSGAYWERTAKALLEQGHRVVMPDQIGFGKSSKPDDVPYSFHWLASNTAALLDELGLDGKVFVVGHSMGGMLATRFALSYPSRTEKLVLVNPIGLEDYQRVAPYRSVDAWTHAVSKATPASIKAYMQKNYFDGVWKAEYDSLLEIQAGWATGPDSAHLARVSALTYDMIYTQPVVHEFGDIEVQTLLVLGQRDRTALGKGDVSPEVAETLGNYPALGKKVAAAIPKCKLVELDRIGHVPQFEAFDAWQKALLEFVSGQR